MQVGEAWAHARAGHPEEALVGLFAALREDDRRRKAAHRTVLDGRARIDALARGLDGTLVAAPSAGEDLLLLRALDQWFAGAGLGGQSSTVSGHTLVHRWSPRAPKMSMPDHLLASIPHHHVLPQELPGGCRLVVKRANDHRSADASVLAGGFTDGVTLVPAAGPYFQAAGLSDANARLTSARALLGHKAGVVVLPELTLTPELESQLADELTSELAVLGSFHVRVGDKVWNQAILRDAAGNTITQRKRTRLHVAGPPEVFEDIVCADEVTAVITPHGLVVVAICKDFLDAHERAVWEAVAPDLVLVPSMGDATTGKLHRETATHLARWCGARAVVANQAPPGHQHELSGGALLPDGPDGLDPKDARSWIRDPRHP
jgi:hypothetical protein